MSTVTLTEVKAWLRVFHTADDVLLQTLLDSAEDEALRFLNRTQPPTLPLDYPPEYDSSSSELPEDIPSSEDPVAPSWRTGICLLVQAYYEAPDGDQRDKMRAAAQSVLFPYRAQLGV